MLRLLQRSIRSIAAPAASGDRQLFISGDPVPQACLPSCRTSRRRLGLNQAKHVVAVRTVLRNARRDDAGSGPSSAHRDSPHRSDGETPLQALSCAPTPSVSRVGVILTIPYRLHDRANVEPVRRHSRCIPTPQRRPPPVHSSCLLRAMEPWIACDGTRRRISSAGAGILKMEITPTPKMTALTMQ